MATRASSPKPQRVLDLGENPVNNHQARIYARESSPGILSVILELTENARDNGTSVTLTIDCEKSESIGGGKNILYPRAVICEDNGGGMSHREFREKFSGAFSDSVSHHETDRAGRNGVGTKTYTSVSGRVLVATTTGRANEGIDNDADKLKPLLPSGVSLPSDGQPDSLWRVYEYSLHTSRALVGEWKRADPSEMGTRVELREFVDGTVIELEPLIERLSFAREWLSSSAHTLTINLRGDIPSSVKKSVTLKPWRFPSTNWLAQVDGSSDEETVVYDPTTTQKTSIPPAEGLGGVLEFDFRVVGRNESNQLRSLKNPALLLEICGALPYAPNLEGTLSSRTLPLLAFVGLEHASSIGAFCNAVSGYARINCMPLKQSLRNNKTTLASAADNREVDQLRKYLHALLKPLHRAWYNATRASQDEVVHDAVRDAENEVNLALKGANRNPFDAGEIKQGKSKEAKKQVRPPARRHRWECGNCGLRWLAAAGFVPTTCGETTAGEFHEKGCGSNILGLASNQPRIGDCVIRIEQLGDPNVPAQFQFDKESEDAEVPTVRVNMISPRYIELRGSGNISGQAQKRLMQYLVDVSLLAIAHYQAGANGSDVIDEIGKLYYGRMLRGMGVKAFTAQRDKILEESTATKETESLTSK